MESCVEVSASLNASLNEYLTKREDNLIIFVNGYRNNGLNMNDDYPNSDNKVRSYDFYANSGSYWDGQDAIKMDKMFIDRIGTKNVCYLDGHHKIYTSNHFVDANNNKLMEDSDIYESKIKFTTSLLTSTCGKYGDYAKFVALYPDIKIQAAAFKCSECYHNVSKVRSNLNTTPNIMGYNYRYNKGKLGGQELWRKIESGEIYVKKDAQGKVIGKIDIVAHSMGYAYAQGVIDELKSHLAPGVKFGIFYILAPENACSASTFNMSIFENVWQYGSDEAEMSTKPWELDGIAPQCKVTGLPDDNRIYIPQTDPNRDFLGAHFGTSYEWIFKKINSNQKGYVTPR